ncbi:AhpC/TSA antioxidant enzyme-domain-containing protein, partial [Melanogaster broomeanus]
MDVSTPLRNSTTGYVYTPLSDAELGYTSDPGSSISHSQTSCARGPIPSAARTATHKRSQTTPDGLAYDLIASSRPSCEITRSSTTPSASLAVFDEHALPTPKQIMDAASCFVVAENGLRVPFGELFRDQKTILIFIRHFWSPLCQDYMFSVANNVDPKLLKQANVNLVVIGNGSYNMIKSYRQIFRTPFTIYTDPSLRLHKALGMTLRTLEPKSQGKQGDYVRHGQLKGIAMVFKNALRVGMPVWEKGGDPTQLGGEFIFGPGLTASYAHRMPNARSHAPITQILAAAGI